MITRTFKQLHCHTVFSFSDTEGDRVDVVFQSDEDEENVVALVVDKDEEEENEDGEALIVDLSPLGATLMDTPVGKFVNLLDLSWMNKSTLIAMLSAGEVGFDAQTQLIRIAEKYFPRKKVARICVFRIKNTDRKNTG